MKFQARLVSFLLGAVMLSAVACSGTAATTNQTAPTIPPSGGAQETSAPAATQVTSAQPTQTTAPTQVMSALPTQTTAAAAATVAAPTTASNSAPPASGSSAWELIANAMRAQASAKSFRSTNITTSDSGTTTTIIEYVAPDRVHVTRTEAAGQGSEIIAIKGQGTWQKVNGKWAKSPVDMSAAVFAFLDPTTIDQLKSTVDIGTVQLVGPELLGTTPTLVYQYTQDIKGAGLGGADLKGSYKVWVGVTDQRVYKLEGDTDSAIKAGAKTHTVGTYEYDINIQIPTPI